VKGERKIIKNSLFYQYFILLISIMIIFPNIFLIFTVKAGFIQKNNIIKTTIYFQSPTLRDIEINNSIFTQIIMPNCFLDAIPGDPVIPYYPISFLIPEGKKLQTISVSYSKNIELYNDLIKKPIMPQQECKPYSFDETEILFIMNESCYNSTGPVLKQIYQVGDIGYCRGYPLITITLYPVQYYPKTGRLFYYQSMTVTVSFIDDPPLESKTSHTLLRKTARDREIISTLVQNPEDISSYYESDEQLLGGSEFLGGNAPLEYSDGLCDPEDSYPFVIITSQSLSSTSGYSYNWSDLIAHRSSYSGLDGIIVIVEDIDACSAYWNSNSTFNDTQAHIREFCKDAYQDWETEYVILGGDWDSTQSHKIVPYRLFTDRFEDNTYNTMACDMYYSHLDGDWYYNYSGGMWGGGKSSGVNDLYGELYVGRICAYNAEMVSNAVQKIINYDTNSSLSDEWLSKVSFWGGNLGWTATSKQYMEEIRLGNDTYRTFTGFEEWNTANPESSFDTTERLYHADLGSSYLTYFDNSVTNDNASIINHIDHSSYNSPFGMTNWQYRYNTKPFFGYSQGCLAGRFQSGYAGCEQMMCKHAERHAFALVLNTGYGYGSMSSTNGASQYLQSFFWDYFFNNQSENQENWQFGKANLYSHDKIAAVINYNSHAWCYAWYSAHYFGDPAQTLRIGDYNHPIATSCETPSDGATDVSINITLLNVTLTNPDGDPFNWGIETSPNIGTNNISGASNGSKTCTIAGLTYSITYTWYVNATDGNTCTNKSFSFTTESVPVNHSPVCSNPSIVNGTTGTTLNISILFITIKDLEGDYFNWSIETTPYIGKNTGNNTSNGSKSCSISSLNYSITYYWFVNVTDGNSWTREYYWFITECAPVNNPPLFLNTSIGNGSTGIPQVTSILSITIYDAEGDDFNWSIETTPYIGSNYGNNDINGSKTCNITNLVPGTLYKWFVNATDGNWTRKWYIFTTNKSPTVSSPNPSNGETNVSLCNSSLSISIFDPDGDSFNWSIETSPNIGNSSSNGANNGSKSCSISGLSYSTTYYWFVNITDGNSYITKSYSFTTGNELLNYPPYIPDSPSPFDGADDIGINSYISWTGGDPNPGDTVTYDVYFGTSSSPSIVVTNQSTNSYNPGILDYDNTYYWKIAAWDDDNTSSTSMVWSFTTEPEWLPPPRVPSSPPPSSPPSPPNQLPTANAGGPYNYCISEIICFNGAGSSDSDGIIVSYIWDFGDGTIIEGQMVNHSYKESGNYTITLLVVDDKNGEDTDTTQAIIITCWDYEEESSKNISIVKNNVSYSWDISNDTILDDLLETLNFSISNVSNVTIIPFYNVSNYLITICNEDGNSSYFFINSVYKIKSVVQKIDDYNLLIDEDNDGVWDHQYNFITSLYSTYSSTQKISENQHVLIINQLMVYILTIVAALIFLSVYFRHNIYSFFSNHHLRLTASKNKNTEFYVNNKCFNNRFKKY
jgi:chitodextrinase